MTERPRVVIDTNVFVAAGFNPRSRAAALLEAVGDGRVILVWDAATRRETERMLHRIPGLDAGMARDLFDAGEEWCTPGDEPDLSMVADPDDRKFAALAARARAVLITNDAHLLDVCDRLPATVTTPAVFLRET